MAEKKKKEKTTNDVAVNLAGLTKTVEDLTLEMRKGFAEVKNANEELAVATKNGFDGVDEKFKKVDEKFKKVDERLDKHDSRFMALELAIKFGFGESKEMFEKLEEKIDKNNTLLDGYIDKQEDFKQEFMVMKEEMDQVKKVIKNKLAVEIKAV